MQDTQDHHPTVRDTRQEAGLGLAELADLLGIDKGYLSRLERGLASPSPSTARSIALALRVGPGTFTYPQPRVDDTGSLPAIADAITVLAALPAARRREIAATLTGHVAS